MSKKESTQKAIESFSKKYAKKYQNMEGPKRRNQKPEKLVESECLDYMRSLEWQVEIYESKATYDPRRGVYRNQSMKAGTCDCMGTLPDGTAVAIEFKAKGKLSTFTRIENIKQQEFITSRIKSNAFAVVVDSRALLQEYFETWSRLRTTSPFQAKDYLHEMLPKRSTVKE